MTVQAFDHKPMTVSYFNFPVRMINHFVLSEANLLIAESRADTGSVMIVEFSREVKTLFCLKESVCSPTKVDRCWQIRISRAFCKQKEFNN